MFNKAPSGESNGKTYETANVDASPSLFMDKRFAHFPNFDYLPPVNLPEREKQFGDPIGEYISLNEPADQTFSDIENGLVDRGFTIIDFGDTSRDNNLACQIFEFSKDGVEKLSIVDGGEFDDGDPLSPGRQVYYIGKILVDSTGAETFYNIFTVVFD